MTSEVWPARYPDLNGKAAVLAGTSSVLVGIARVFCDNGVMPALVVDDRDSVEAATAYAEQLGVTFMGIVADAAERSTWDRVTQHIEQRLGPIDIAAVVAPPAVRMLVASALMPDMAARRRGVVVEVGASVESMEVPAGLRHRAVSATAGVRALDIAAAVLLSASDVLDATQVQIALAAS
ncbi:MAG TPA: hypothetical protein VHD81_09205 [Mycobacteriales bacterium]|nr:hypothetical protein [Mycobacteriales bacterium]